MSSASHLDLADQYRRFLLRWNDEMRFPDREGEPRRARMWAPIKGETEPPPSNDQDGATE